MLNKKKKPESKVWELAGLQTKEKMRTYFETVTRWTVCR